MTESDNELSVNFLPGNPLSYTTTRIRIFRNELSLGTATGFTIKFADRYSLVTNWHVLSGYNPSNGQCLSDSGALPNRIECHVSVSRPWRDGNRTGEQLHFKPVSIPLWQDDNPVWIDEVDVSAQNDYAVIDLAAYVPELKEAGVSLRSILGGEVIAPAKRSSPLSGNVQVHVDEVKNIYPEIGTEVFVIGYPRGIAGEEIFPIWKRGSIASEPQVPIRLGGRQHKNVFYIDALTKSGMSGSPVICFSKPGERFSSDDGDVIQVRDEKPRIVGVYSGRNGVTQEEYELSVGRVWKIGAIERVLIKSARLQDGIAS
jgi:hypothetical protein